MSVKPGFVQFTSEDGTSVTVRNGDTSPVMVSGYGGWEVVQRPRRPGLTRYKGKDPFRQDIAILFDGWKGQNEQEQDIYNLEQMADQKDYLGQPPVVHVAGHALRIELDWVIEDLTFDGTDAIWKTVNDVPARLRQGCIVHLLEFVDDTVLVTPASPAITAIPTPNTVKPSNHFTTPDGMTIKQLALIFLGDPDKYMIVLQYNPTLSPDPRILIPAGTYIAVPPGSFVHTPFFRVP